MTTSNKIVKAIENCIGKPKCSDCPWEPCEEFNCERVDMPLGLVKDALRLIKVQEPRVMTAKDMWMLKFNDTVILEQKIPSLLIPAIVRDNIKHDDALEVLQVVTASTDRGANADYDYYGKTWRCWTAKPSEKQMEETPWDK